MSDPLSSNDRRLWQIHQHICITWNVYTAFTVAPPNVPLDFPGMIHWLVPRDCDHAFEIHQWLEHELQQFVYQFDIDGHNHEQQVHVAIADFDDIDCYVSRDESRQFAEQATAKLLRWWDADIAKQEAHLARQRLLLQYSVALWSLRVLIVAVLCLTLQLLTPTSQLFLFFAYLVIDYLERRNQTALSRLEHHSRLEL